MTDSTAVVVMPRNLVEVSLDDLAKMANEESLLVEGHLRQALAHARRCGDLLLAARDQVERGEFRRWVQENTDLTYEKALAMQRIAFYFNHLPADQVGTMSVGSAQAALTGLPGLNTPAAEYLREVDPPEKGFTRMLLDDGLAADEVAQRMGVPLEVVLRWHDEKAFRRWKAEKEKYSAARMARERERRWKIEKAFAALEALELSRQTSSSTSKVYGQVRKLLASLDSLTTETGDELRRMEYEGESGTRVQRDLAHAVNAAASAARTCEQRIGQALRLERDKDNFK